MSKRILILVEGPTEERFVKDVLHAEYRRQETEGRRQRSEVRGWRSEVGRQRAEVRGQRAEGRKKSFKWLGFR